LRASLTDEINPGEIRNDFFRGKNFEEVIRYMAEDSSRMLPPIRPTAFVKVADIRDS